VVVLDSATRTVRDAKAAELVARGFAALSTPAPKTAPPAAAPPAATPAGNRPR
jgi:D-alanyl-D-alanine carboxypeptidase